LWLLEELGTPFEMKRYQRDATTRLRRGLTAGHPLGKSARDCRRRLKIAESGATVDYLIRATARGQ